jgi:hypothetical protein
MTIEIDAAGIVPKSRTLKMRMAFIALLCSALTGLSVASSPVTAQQKTEKACKSEWQAYKADNQAKGITEKAYVDQCRSGRSTLAQARGA